MTNNTMSVFAQQLCVGETIKNKTAARINGGNVGPANYADWKKAMEKAQHAAYDYKRNSQAHIQGKAEQSKELRVIAMDSLKGILDLIGDINGHPISRDESIFTIMVDSATKVVSDSQGEALLLESKRDNLKAELKNINDGVDPAWLESKNKELDSVLESLALAKKSAGSGKLRIAEVSFVTFCADFERKLSALVFGQAMKSWEELEAEKQKKREERNARHKAQRQANKKSK